MFDSSGIDIVSKLFSKIIRAIGGKELKEVKVNKKNITFLNGLGYLYIPTFIFLISGYMMRGYNLIFISSFFTVVTLAYFSSYYIVNKNFDKIKGERFIGLVIPLMFAISVVLAIALNILLSL